MSKASQAIPIFPASNKAHADKLASSLGEHAHRWMQQNQFKAKAFSHCLIPAEDGSIAAVIAGINPESPLQALAALPKNLPQGNYVLQTGFDESWQQQAQLGWQLGQYKFTRYSANQMAKPELEQPSADSTTIKSQTDATNLVRDLINTPTEDMGPEQLELATARLAAEYKATLNVITGTELEEGFPAIHIVGRASHRAPRLLHLTWGNNTHPKIAIVGKGVCFDTGGLNMKSGVGMSKMKKDMGGAAHALALAQLIMENQLPVQIELLVPAVENAIAGNAYRPGDVASTRQGLNIEIGNTDAEGRVILADALTYACEQQPELVIDFATLTGAARVALGTDLPALFSNDANLRRELHICGDEIEDPMWPMPLYQPYMRLIKSDIAQFNNSASTGFGGCITAALFLQQFVDKQIPWCHLDTYGWNDIDRPGRPAGGEAMGLRACFRLLQKRYVDQ